MADENDVREPDDDGAIEVEIVPEPAEERPRLKGDTRSLDVRDDEISGYGKEVQGRIKKLRFAFHEERRLREQSQRDQQAAADLAQRLFRENAELKRNVRAGEQAVVHQAISRVDAEIEQAKSKNRSALESGVSDDIVAANANLARAIAEKERLQMLKLPPVEEEEKPQPPAAAPPPQPDEHTREWMQKNPWWDQPGEEERTGFAMGIHNQLLKRGITARGNPEVYWRTINERLAAVFPDKHGNGNGHSNGAPEKDRGSRPLAVAGGMRSATGATSVGRTGARVRLTESQVRLAHRLGLTPEQYAESVLAMENQEAS